MRLLYVPLAAEQLERLVQLAQLERREPRQQAALMLERALEVEELQRRGDAAHRFHTRLQEEDAQESGMEPASC